MRSRNIFYATFFLSLLFLGNYNFNRPRETENRNQRNEQIERISESDLERKAVEDGLERVEQNIARRYVDIYFKEASGKIDSIDGLVKERGIDETKRVFYDIESVPLRIIKGEIDIEQGVSDTAALYDEIDDRMNWKSKHIIDRIKEEIDYKVSMYKKKVKDRVDRLTEEDVEGLITQSESVLEGIKNELAANMNKYTRFIPFGEDIILFIADKKMDASRKVVRRVYDRMLEEK